MQNFASSNKGIKNIANLIDHTLLKADATSKEIEKLCMEAIQYEFAAVCVNPVYVAKAYEHLRNTAVKVCTVIGFPLGATFTEIKKAEAIQALNDGANELDMVISIGALKEGNFNFISSEIRQIAKIVNQKNAILKVIIETALLTEKEKIIACKIIAESGGHFVKTSTGFSKSGATVEDIKLLKKHSPPTLKIKASGGIRSFLDAIALIDAGADRIGTSSGVAIVSESTDNLK